MPKQLKKTDAELKKLKKKRLIENCVYIDIAVIYFFMLIGHQMWLYPNSTVIDAFTRLSDNPGIWTFFKILPTAPVMLLLAFAVAMVSDALMYNNYLVSKEVVASPHGDDSFMEDVEEYNKEFVIDPDIVERELGKKVKTYNLQDYDQEYKKVVDMKIKQDLSNPIFHACWKNTQVYGEGVGMSLHGSWCQRNTNAIVFGGSGSGKTRYFLAPNLLQANSSYIVTDPAGEIMASYAAFLEKEEGYIIKCINTKNMMYSCRFNPLSYIRTTSDIPKIAKTFMENTKDSGKTGGDPFWDQASIAFYCAVIGYLYEVEPFERRTFYNVMELLRLAAVDENAQETEETEFDEMMLSLGEANPNSYAYKQYKTFKLAPAKTALSILISAGVLLGNYIDNKEFNNICYKDEMELYKFGAAPFKLKVDAEVLDEDKEKYQKRYSQMKNALEKGYIDVEDFEKYKEADLLEYTSVGNRKKYVEGKPYKMAIFLNIPTADKTFNWFSAMLYSITFQLIYQTADERLERQCMSGPTLAYPARFLIDECANIGKIPNLQEYLATCRKYALSIVPIFQSFSQLEKAYGKEEANSIYANCDTTVFLGGKDGTTIDLIVKSLGKTTVQGETFGSSGSGSKKTGNTNRAQVGKEVMTRTQIEQMNNAKCLILTRGIKPFFAKKINLNKHENYKFTSENNPEKYSYINPFVAEYDDYEVEGLRIKLKGEEGYVAPKTVNSARLKALQGEQIKDLIKKVDGILDEAPEFFTGQASDMQAAAINAIQTTAREAEKLNAVDQLQRLNEVADYYGFSLGIENLSELLGACSGVNRAAVNNKDEPVTVYNVSPEEMEKAVREGNQTFSFLTGGLEVVAAEFEFAEIEDIIIGKIGSIVETADGNLLSAERHDSNRKQSDFDNKDGEEILQDTETNESNEDTHEIKNESQPEIKSSEKKDKPDEEDNDTQSEESLPSKEDADSLLELDNFDNSQMEISNDYITEGYDEAPDVEIDETEKEDIPETQESVDTYSQSSHSKDKQIIESQATDISDGAFSDIFGLGVLDFEEDDCGFI